MRLGEQLLLEIDWQGARQVRARLPEARSIFILPPSRERARGAAQGAQHRLRSGDRAPPAGRGARTSPIGREFDYVVINDRFDQALDDLLAIVRRARRSTRLAPIAPEVARLAAAHCCPVN